MPTLSSGEWRLRLSTETPSADADSAWLEGIRRSLDATAEGDTGRLTLRPASFSLLGQPEAEAESPQPRHENATASTSNSQNESNNPLTPKITLNVHDYYVPSFYGLDDRQANQLLLRGVIPHKLFDAPQLFRFTLPIAEAPTFPDGTDSGLGDLTLIDWFMFKGGGLEFGVGPLLVAPTASTEALGAGKWQAGAAGIVVAAREWGILGSLVTFQQSFASQGGDTDRDDVSLLTVQPLAIYNLPEGFYLRSTAIWNFDFDKGDYYIPVGLGVGKVWQLGGGATLNTFIEPQYTVFHDGVAPQWQIFAGVNLQFSF